MTTFAPAPPRFTNVPDVLKQRPDVLPPPELDYAELEQARVAGITGYLGTEALVTGLDHVEEHAQARSETHTPADDYAAISHFLGTTRDVFTDTARKKWWLMPIQPLFIGLAVRKAVQAHREDPQEVQAVVEVAHRRAIAIQARVGKASVWMLDEVKKVDWWDLAETVSSSPEIHALVNASLATGPYGEAAKGALTAITYANNVHKAALKHHGDGRVPGLFSGLVSTALQNQLARGGRGEVSKGMALAEELLRAAAQQRRDAAAKK